MKAKLLVIIFTFLVFTLGVSFADGGSEPGQAPDKMTGSSRPVESESSDSGITKKHNFKDKGKTRKRAIQKDNSHKASRPHCAKDSARRRVLTLQFMNWM